MERALSTYSVELAKKSVGKNKPQKHFWWYFALFAVFVIAIWRRISELSFNFDGDEIFSLSVANDTWQGFVARALHDRPHPPLHLILLREWVALFGSSEVEARSLSVILSLGCLALVLFILWHRVKPTTAVAVGLVISVSSFLVHYGQEARPYALLSFLAALNLWGFLNVLETPKKAFDIALFAVSCFLLVYCQYLGAVSIAVEAVILCIRYPLRTAAVPAAAGLLAGFLIFPWWWFAFHGDTSMPSLIWNARPKPPDLIYLFLGGIGWPPLVARYLLLAFCIALFALASALGRRSFIGWETAGLTALAIIPACIVFILSFQLSQSIWAPRQLIPSVLAFLLIVAFAVDSLPQGARLLSAALLVLWAVAGYSDGLESRRTPPWQEIARTVEEKQLQATVLGESPWVTNPLSHYTDPKRVRIMDLKNYDAGLTSPLYVVCRYTTCNSFVKKNSLAELQEVRIDKWDYRGGEPRGIILTYRLR